MTEIIVPIDKAWEFGIQNVFHGGKEEIARREIEPGIGLSVYIEGFRENSENDFGFAVSVDNLGVRRESGNVYWMYAPVKEALEEFLEDIYRAFLGLDW